MPRFYALCLNDNIQKGHEIGTAAGRSLLLLCDKMWGFGDKETEGVRAEIQFCNNLNVRIHRIRDSIITKKIGR